MTGDTSSKLSAMFLVKNIKPQVKFSFCTRLICLHGIIYFAYDIFEIHLQQIIAIWKYQDVSKILLCLTISDTILKEISLLYV